MILIEENNAVSVDNIYESTIFCTRWRGGLSISMIQEESDESLHSSPAELYSEQINTLFLPAPQSRTELFLTA